VIPDADLLRSWADGDQRAGRELFDRHYPALYRFFRNKANHGVDDLVQDTFLACIGGLQRFRGDGSFRAYLFGTARNILHQHYKRKRRKDDLVDFGTHSVVDLGAGPTTIMAQRGEHRLLLEALRRLPVDAQIVLELYMWESLTGPELAEMLELTERAVRSRIHRAKQRLNAELEALAESRTLLESTNMNLDAWARGIRNLMTPAAES
jgi:RNA polymerase sigma factor (sigma-70 family)